MTNLSPAAQAVLDAAAGGAVSDIAAFPLLRLEIAAALCAAADQVVPLDGPALLTTSEERMRCQLLAIAAELGGADG